MRSYAAAALIGLAGCGGQRLNPGMSPRQPSLQPLSAARGRGSSVRTICHGASIPRNWAITDYVASSQCVSNGRTYNAMLVEDLSSYAIGSVVLICADQRRPADWDFTGEDVGVTSQCPREPTNKSTSPTVVEIVRRRQSD